MQIYMYNFQKNKKGESILTDTRFKSLFSNPDFEIDENSERYQLIQPAIKKIKDRQEKLLDDNSHEAGTKVGISFYSILLYFGNQSKRQ